jgi:ParB family chromosome partitioning protein
MTKKKRFGISEALTRGLSETINVVENNLGTYRNVVLPLSRIELDPENPRKLCVNLADVRTGIQSDDQQYQQKHDELDKLKELAHTIKSSGVINPIVVYKLGEFYRVVAGERRCLASIIAGKQEIEARVFNEKPRGFELKLIQWIENTAREDLSLGDRLGNVRDIMREYQNQHDTDEMSATLLKSITGLSLPQATYYVAALNAPQDVQTEINNGNIRNLDKAALLAGISSPLVRAQVIEACVNGSSLKELRSMVQQQKTLQRNKATLKPVPQGRVTAKINMGSTSQSEVVKAVIQCVVGQGQYKKFADVFGDINWQDMRQTTKAFRKLIELLELEVAV